MIVGEQWWLHQTPSSAAFKNKPNSDLKQLYRSSLAVWVGSHDIHCAGINEVEVRSLKSIYLIDHFDLISAFYCFSLERNSSRKGGSFRCISFDLISTKYFLYKHFSSGPSVYLFLGMLVLSRLQKQTEGEGWWVTITFALSWQLARYTRKVCA